MQFLLEKHGVYVRRKDTKAEAAIDVKVPYGTVCRWLEDEQTLRQQYEEKSVPVNRKRRRLGKDVFVESQVVDIVGALPFS